MKLKIEVDLSKFIALPKKGEQGYNVVITPRLGEDVLTENEASFIAESMNKMFKED